jgi:hypothetical protein
VIDKFAFCKGEWTFSTIKMVNEVISYWMTFYNLLY